MMYSFSRLRPVSIATAAVVLFAGGPGALAQTNYGTVRGQVKDASGAHVKDATIILTNLETKVERTTHTTDAGIYTFSAVDPGTYKITISQPGFKNFENTGVRVELGNTATIDAAMAVGGAGEVVEVTAEAPLLDTASASGGQTFSEQQLQDLPNLGRNPFIFEKLDSNVVTTGDPRYVRAEDQTGLSQVSVGGAPIGSNNYVVDGIPISRSDGGVTFIPSPEAVSDAKVQVNTYDGEVGRTGGGVFNTSLKSGGAEYHGVLYGETRQTNWSANVWFNPTKAATPDNTTYLYAGAFGGPLPFMKKVKWLDKTFFWVTEEGYRQAQFYPSSSGVSRVPTARERNGDFSESLIAGGAVPGSPVVQLYDPTSPITGGRRTQALAGNVIPTAYINPVGRAVLNAYPTANTSGTGYNYNLLNTFKTRSDMYNGKLEHTFAPWWTSSASYVHLATQEPSGFLLGSAVAQNANKLLRYNDATAVNSTFTVTPTTLLTVGWGFNRYYSASFQYSNDYNIGPSGLGFSNSFTNQIQGSPTFPTIALSNLTNSRGLGGANGTVQVQASQNLVVGVTKTLNRQNIKVGYVYRLLKFRSTPNSAPSFTFNGQYTNVTPGTLNANNAQAFADILIGQPSAASYTLNSGSFTQLAGYHGIYVQDDFRVSSKLTLNAGLRYEYEQGQRESNNRFNVAFDPSATSTLATTTGTKALRGGLLFAGQNGAPVNAGNQSNIKFSPRFGLAWQVIPKTVFHAGFGVFYSPVALAYVAQGYSQSTSYAPTAPTSGLAGTVLGSGAYLTNPFPAGSSSALVQPSGNSLGSLTGVGTSLGTVIDLARRYPFVQQYSADVQQEMPGGINLRISYVGAHARNFANSSNINQLNSAQLEAARVAGVQLNTATANPLQVTPGTTINGYAPTGVVASATVPIAQTRLPFPQFTSVTVSQDNGYSRYNSLAIKVQKRMKNGLTLLSTYTWASNWDNLWSAGSQVYNNYGPQDAFNPKGEYSRALANVPNRFTAAISYELPFGRGKALFSHVPRFVDMFINNWQINDEWMVQNGVPLSIIQTNQNTAYGTTGVGGAQQRPNILGDIHTACRSGSPQGRLGVSSVGTGPTYLNVAAFSPAAPFTYGNTPRTLPCATPGSNNTDASINKAFTIGERVKLQFRAEALNAFNTPQFATPASTFVVQGTFAAPTAATGTNQTLGNVTSQINYPRIIQLGGRITF